MKSLNVYIHIKASVPGSHDFEEDGERRDEEMVKWLKTITVTTTTKLS